MPLPMTQDYEFMTETSSDRLTTFQQEKVESHLKMVKWVVTRITDRFSHLPPHIEISDLIHSGILGLIDAVKRFSWGRQNEEDEFKAYAECRIRGQVIDEFRNMDVLPRSARDKVKQFRKIVDTLRQQLQREPSVDEVAKTLEIDVETYHQLRREANFGKQITADTVGPQTDALEGLLSKALDTDLVESPESLVYSEEMRNILAAEIQNLNEKEKIVVSLYYYDELTLKEIGAVLSITESRVSQIHTQALGKLTKRLKQDLDNDSISQEIQND